MPSPSQVGKNPRGKNKSQHRAMENKRARLAENPPMEYPLAQLTETVQIGNQPAESVAIIDGEDGEFWPLSGRPYFSLVLTRSHVKPTYNMYFPAKIQPLLPYNAVPITIRYRGKDWKPLYFGEGRRKRLDMGWKTFVVDNNLNVGDAMVFELLESSRKIIKFRVQILRGDFPNELLEKASGESAETPLILD